MPAVPRMWRSENDAVELILSFHFCIGPGTGTQACSASAFTQLSQLARPGFVKRFFFFNLLACVGVGALLPSL